MPKPTAAKRIVVPMKRRDGPRAPSRGRGIARFTALVDATEALLLKHDPNEIGLYQIASHAGVPPASVYHFFPTKEAAFKALADRIAAKILEIHRRPIDARAIGTWMDLFRIDARRAMEFHNASRPAIKIYYGAYAGVEAREVDKVLVHKISTANYDRLNRIFYMPQLNEPGRMFEVRIGILDAVWELSVRQHGYITEQYFEESCRAVIAYTRLYMPEHLERRPLLIEAAAKGQALVLPFGDDDSPPAAD